MNFYLEKYGFQKPKIAPAPAKDLEIIVVIPCFNEPDLVSSLNSLDQCSVPNCGVEVIVVLNSGEQHSSQIKEHNLKTKEAFEKFAEDSKYTFHLINEPELPKKQAGVGLARKIGMDEAVARFHSINTNGIIACFDADAICDPNYLVELEKHFKANPKTPACSIYYEHPISGDFFSEEIYQGITQYELHLRYYNQALRYCELPYAYHTVGSSMAVRSSAYQKQGGMNKRKAGEDFYFIHKIIALGNFTELNSTRIIPSPRTSDRVPFGTGKAIADWMEDDRKELLSYSMSSFKEIKTFVGQVETIYLNTEDLDVRDHFKVWLTENEFEAAVTNAKANSTSFESFKKRFFTWFDAFKVLKLVHFLRDNVYPNEPIFVLSKELLLTYYGLEFKGLKEQALLLKYREIEKVK